MAIYLMGDIHGNYQPIRDFYQRNKDEIDNNKDENYLFLLGDSGLNYFLNKRDEELKTQLGKYPFKYFIIRGNHEQRAEILNKENPTEWHGEALFGNEVRVENKFPYIYYAADIAMNYFININGGIRVLVIPGAFSVDKEFRLMKGWSWFPEEQLSDKEKELAEAFAIHYGSFDVILSHTCPKEYEPYWLYMRDIDQSKVDKSMELLLEKIRKNVKFKAWCWGHYHAHYEYLRENSNQPPTEKDPRYLMLFNQGAVRLEDVLTKPYEVRLL